MFRHLFGFELRFWLRGLMVYVFLLIVAILIFGAMTSDDVVIGSALENTYKNAPFVIQNFYAVMTLSTLLMTTAFVNSAATRDFQYDTHQIIFTTPLRKFDYLMGRFWGATIVAMLPMLGVSLAALIARFAPWNDPEQWGPVIASAHLNSILIFVIPNTLFIAAIIFAIATFTRSTMASFIGGLLLLVCYSIANVFTQDMENETLAILVDPFGMRAFALLTKYWTVAEKNVRSVGLSGMMLANRLIWVSVGLAIFTAAYSRFRFTERHRRATREVENESALVAAPAGRPASFNFDLRAQFAQLWSQIKLDFFGTMKSTVFIVIVVFAAINISLVLAFNAAERYGISSFPVTYAMVDLIRSALSIFLIAIITFYGGALVWKERDAKTDEIYDALPHLTWITYTSKLIALIGLTAVILACSILMGVIVQTFHGYTKYELGLYLKELLVLDLLSFSFLTVLAMLVHILSPNKYMGYFLFVVLLIVNSFIWGVLNVATNMLQFGNLPNYTYSAMFGFAPFVRELTWFSLYWVVVCALLSLFAVLVWQRGKEKGWGWRLRNLQLSFVGNLRSLAVVGVLLLIVVGGWVFYNTKVLHRISTSDDNNRRIADYEKTYKQYQNLVQPRITDVKYDIAIYPEERNIVFKGEQRLVNKTSQSIDELHLTLDNSFLTEVEIERAALDREDTRLAYRIYKLSPPLAPHESLQMRYIVKSQTRGFENEVSLLQVVQNGTFFNNTIAPQIGYQPGAELTERNDRKELGLPEKDRMPILEPDCTQSCMDTYLSNNSDWVNVETIISTSPDQVAIAPGSLQKEWQEGGRRYFQYRLDHPSLNFYSFISARYEVAREEWNGIQMEVYYHPGHEYNVPKMMNSIRKSLEYFTTNFSDYKHRQARIIEFPRVASFAQAFPGTMPYSESIGFIANLRDPEDIDLVFYVTAHEMGHQWWAHQVIGANMQGATSLSETLAQYSALMVMEKEYGRDLMRKFLQYEMDRYLRSRGRETIKEQPLLKVESSQGYVHYNKGSVVLYYIKEMIGEAAVNQALRQLINQYAYKEPPYPTSYALLDALLAQTPDQLKPIYKDLFEEITLYSNRTTQASYQKREDGKYEITITVESKKFKADEKGNETEVPVNDLIEIGAFAKPEAGKRYGKTLHRERVTVASGVQSFTFTVDEEPDKAGIDPFNLLIDRVPDDNVRRVNGTN